MKVGLIGRQGSGRSTLFTALTGLQRRSQAAGKTQLGIARVPDSRVDRLTSICKPKKTTYAEIILALIPAAPTGPLDVMLVRQMRELRALAHVVGAFAGESAGSAVVALMDELTTELVLADMERVETRRTRIGKGGHARTREDEMLARAAAGLDRERPLRLEAWDEQQLGLMDELMLMSHRPLITVANVDEAQAAASPPNEVVQAAQRVGSRLMWLCAPLEAELATLQDGEQAEFLAAYGLSQPAAVRFVRAAFSLLDQICFFTEGPDEVKAWPIQRGTVARRAARTIHSDLERGFIRAEVMAFEDFVEQGSEARCRSAGLLRTEGKDYVVRDGDIITVRFNV
jgi:ribosome-binding ATPase YchF (GTP1/OBG family)